MKPLPLHNKYQLVEDYPYLGGIVPAGFPFNGASVPPIADRITYTPFRPDVMAAALVHDWHYLTHIIEREAADRLFYDMLLESGADPDKARLMYTALKWFGGFAWEPSKKEADSLMILWFSLATEHGPDVSRYRIDQAECLHDISEVTVKKGMTCGPTEGCTYGI